MASRRPPAPTGGTAIGRFLGPGRFASPRDSRDIEANRAAGKDPRWAGYFADDPSAQPSEDTIRGAAGLMEDASLIGKVVAQGPYRAVSFDRYGSQILGSSDYWSQHAGNFYAPRTYSYDDRFGGYDAEITPEEATTPEGTAALSVAAVSSVGKWAAPITQSPTSSSYPKRPRTVAAGFDGYRKVLTVVFRDGTFYNYYGVSNLEWGTFVSAISKGKHIRKFLDAKVRGPADMSAIPDDYKELMYRVARTAQVMAKGRQANQRPVK